MPHWDMFFGLKRNNRIAPVFDVAGHALLVDVKPDSIAEELLIEMPKVIEFLNRVNYQLYAENFEMDSRDAEIRYKDTIDARGGVLTPLMLEIMFFRNLFTIDEYVPAIMNVAYTEITSAQALMQMAKSREVES